MKDDEIQNYAKGIASYVEVLTKKMEELFWNAGPIRYYPIMLGALHISVREVCYLAGFSAVCRKKISNGEVISRIKSEYKKDLVVRKKKPKTVFFPEPCKKRESIILEENTNGESFGLDIYFNAKKCGLFRRDIECSNHVGIKREEVTGNLLFETSWKDKHSLEGLFEVCKVLEIPVSPYWDRNTHKTLFLHGGSGFFMPYFWRMDQELPVVLNEIRKKRPRAYLRAIKGLEETLMMLADTVKKDKAEEFIEFGKKCGVYIEV